MKQRRNPVQQITIKESTPAPSRKNYSVNSSLSKKQYSIKPDDISQQQNLQNNPQLHSIREVADIHVPAQNQQQPSENNEPSQQTQNLEQSKIHELKNNLSSLSVSVSDIKHDYNDLNDSITKILTSPKTKPKRKITKLDHPQIAQFLFKKQQEQQQRQKRRLDEIARLQKIKAEKQQNQQKQKHQEKQQKINSLKKQWFVKEKNQSLKQEQSQKQKQAEQIFKKYRNSIPLFQIKEKLSKQQQTKKIQLMKEYLKKQKENYMALNQSVNQKELQSHKKKHEEKVAELDKQKNQAKIPIFQKIQKDNESLKNLYRGKVTQRVMEDLKLQEQKREIPYRIRERTRGYQSHVKQNYKPKLRPSKLRSNSSSLEIKSKRNNDSNLSVRDIKRYKYIQGVSFGEIVEQRHMAKSYEDEKRTGNGYLEYMKSLPKKRISPVEQTLIIPVSKTSRPNPLLHIRKPKGFVKLTDEPTRDEINMILQQLRQNDKRLKEKEKIAYIKGHKHELMDADRREINDELLLNVEKKMDLLHKLQNNKVKMGNEQDKQDEDEDY